MKSINVAHFPILGPKLNPSREDYLQEARLLLAEANRLRSTPAANRLRVHLRRKATVFERIARRLTWVPTPGRRIGHAASYGGRTRQVAVSPVQCATNASGAAQ